MYKTITGICPAQNKEYSISVEYHDVSNSTERHYVRGLLNCDYHRKFRCPEKHCPLFALAPENL